MKIRVAFWGLLLVLLSALPVAAQEESAEEVLQGNLNIVWTCIAAFMVMFMQPGFAMLEGVTGSDSAFTFLIFQTVFAATAATIVSGAVAERTKFVSYLCAIAPSSVSLSIPSSASGRGGRCSRE